jgi:uncharacterized protein (TIGR01777 family)
MKILITGGTGFIGSELVARFVRDGHQVTILTRSPKGFPGLRLGVAYLSGDPTQKGPWQEAVCQYDVIVNLAGASIFHRWTKKHKKAIRESRVRTTRHVVESIHAHSRNKVTLFSSSAVGYYGFRGDEELFEDSSPGDDFLARTCGEWEKEARKASEKGARVVITRLGIVLGERGGALGQMIPLFRKYIGGPIGNGRQWFSWIHIKDLTEAFIFLMAHPEVTGPVNFCSPHPLRNRDLAKSLGKALHRPSFIPAPAFFVKLALGEFGSVVLKGQRVIPRRLLEQGFVFQYGDMGKALQDIIPTSNQYS